MTDRQDKVDWVDALLDDLGGAAPSDPSGELMARVLGADGHPFVTIPHPISSATRDQLAQAARVAADDLAVILTAD